MIDFSITKSEEFHKIMPTEDEIRDIDKPIASETAEALAFSMAAPLSRGHKRHVIVQCDVSKVDNHWHDELRIPPFPKDIPHWRKYLRLKEAINNNKVTGCGPPEIVYRNIDKKSSKRVAIQDGRNRFAHLRDAGLARVPCEIHRSDHKRLYKLGVVIDPPPLPQKRSKRNHENAPCNGTDRNAVDRSGAIADAYKGVAGDQTDPLSKKLRF
jgi:hypothetical protein